MNTIADEFADFAVVIPRTAPEVQRQEMRRAFFAGAHAMLIMHARLADDSVSEAAACALIDAWHDETAQFARDVVAGRM